MKNKIVILQITLLASLFLNGVAHAQPSTENSATPEVLSEPGAKLLITEVNFKNKQNDWVELYYESPARQSFNIKGFQFQDDNVFKKIDGDYVLNSGQYYTLTFKSADADNAQTRTLATTRSGLTGTTEQMIIKDPGGKIIDAVCWASATPTNDEVKDMQKLFQAGGWTSPDPASCFPSANVGTNQSIARNNFNDTNSVDDWSLAQNTTAGAANNTDTGSSNDSNSSTANANDNSSSQSSDSGDTTNDNSMTPIFQTGPADNTTSNDASDTTTSTSSSPKSSSAKKASKSKKSSSAAPKTVKKSSTKNKKYKTGDVSSDIIISEILPHPSKDQRNNEWIELTNTGDTTVNLGNWQLDDSDGGSKPYTLPDTLKIQPGNAVIIGSHDSKLSLGDSKDQVRLFDPTGKLLQTVDYDEAPKDQSYAWITVDKEDGSMEQQWLWENTPTPGVPNPPYKEMTGTIVQDPEFADTYHFILQTSGGAQHTVLFSESLIAGPLAKATFTKGTQIKILGISLPSTNATENETQQISTEQFASNSEQDLPNAFQLKKFEVIQAASPPNPNADPSSPWMFFGLLPPGGAGFWYGVKKIRKIYGKI